MSIIFQTLNKLQAASLETSSAPVDGDRASEAEVVPASRRRPLVVTGIVAAAFILLGFAFIFGARFLVEHASGSAGEVEAGRHIPAKGDRSVTEAPVRDTIAVQDTTPRYLPPEETPTPVRQQAAAPMTSAAEGTSAPDSPVDVAVKAQPAVPERHDNRTTTPPPVVQPTAAKVKTEASPTPPSNVPVPAVQTSVAVPEPVSAEQRKLEKVRQAASEKNERIRRLVSRIEAALASTSLDNHRIETSLDELARLKQPGSPYVNKLRAYWLLKTGKYDQAKALLENLAALDEDDPEIGINLAVIDIRHGEVQAALLRLQRLKKAHPDNARLTELIRKLQ